MQSVITAKEVLPNNWGEQTSGTLGKLFPAFGPPIDRKWELYHYINVASGVVRNEVFLCQHFSEEVEYYQPQTIFFLSFRFTGESTCSHYFW